MSDQVLKVATYNANSIRSQLGLVLEWLGRESPDILCLQETKVRDVDFPAETLGNAGYYVVFRGKGGHAGVAIVSREGPQECVFGFGDGGDPDEDRLIHAVIGGIPVVNTYVPQGHSPDSHHFRYKLEWLERLGALFERHHSPQEPLLWMGDFNVAPEPIDVHDAKRLKGHVDFHPEARAALERVKEWGFVDVFRLHHPEEPGHYTFWDYRVRDALERGIGWRVDHIWATKPLAHTSNQAWIDLTARRAKRPSDHTFLVAAFTL